MSNSSKPGTGMVRFEMRLSATDAVRLEATAARLNLSKADVLRLSLSPEFGREKLGACGKEVAAVSESLDALGARAAAVESRMRSLESLLDSAVDLLLSLTRSMQHGHRESETRKEEKSDSEPLPSWQAYLAKNPKLNPIMTEAKWHEFLRERYRKEFGCDPEDNP